MASSLTQILNNEGFQSVAWAVRRATVNAQAQKAMKVKDYREIRYDLLHDLRRTRSLPGNEPFVEAISDFISKYNAENARRREMNKRAPRNVTTDEFLRFAELVQEHQSPLVGALLCAYGSCREPRDEEAASLDAPDTGSAESEPGE